MKKTLVILGLILGIATSAFATADPGTGGLSATYHIDITAENYALFVGGTSVTSISFVGGAVTTPLNGGWSTAEQYSATINEGDYIYVAVLDCCKINGLLGDFTTTDSGYENFVTGAAQGWEFLTVEPSNICNLIQLKSSFCNIFDWEPVTNVFYPAFSVAEIDSSAKCIWDDKGNGFHQIGVFRKQISVTPPAPEPASMILFGLGSCGFWAFRRKK